MTGIYKLVCDGTLWTTSNSLEHVKEWADDLAWCSLDQWIFKGATAYSYRECGYSSWNNRCLRVKLSDVVKREGGVI